MTLPTQYQEYIALSRYARYNWQEKRRETWSETVDRVVNFWRNNPKTSDVAGTTFDELRTAILNLEVMPSMRTLMTAGKALDRDNVAGYNCSYAAIQGEGGEIELWDKKLSDAGFDEPITVSLRSPIVFDEIMYILLCGTGVGFSVERQFINTLPTIGKKLSRNLYKRTKKNYPGVAPEELSILDKKTNTIHVADSKYGWASALRILIVELYNANFEIKWDLSQIRPAGDALKTFGGRASGPDPLNALFTFVSEVFAKANGRKLSSVECHDVVCKIAEVVVVGGVRRSALISLSNLSDDRMAKAKSGDWWMLDPQRALANNSVCYTERPTVGAFMREWQNLYESKSGERGIFNREAARNACIAIGRDPNHDFGTNPCSEIILRPNEFCNLSEVVIRPDDDSHTLTNKVRLATILGTMQATLTDFVYLSPTWKKNCTEEALLGVSLTGWMDHPLLSTTSRDTQKLLSHLQSVARQTNRSYAILLKINASAAITCVKPSGTVSQLVDCASGVHPRYSKYYIRTVRADKKDPLADFMIAKGFPYEEDRMQTANWIFSFPMEAPDHAVMRDGRTALEQLEHWLMVQRYWCEHKPSITVYVREHEWMEVGAWVWKHFDEVSGVSFLPHSDHTYAQAPYQEISHEEFLKLKAAMPKNVDWAQVANYELSDQTTGSQELACVGGACEIL